jgi:hypothetical protein
MSDALIAALAKQTDAITALVESNATLAAAVHALADAIAAPVEDEPAADDVPRYMDGTPID